MTVLAFLAITFGAGAAGLLTRRRPPVSIAIGLVGLAAALVSALLVSPGDRLVVGESALVATDFMHLFIVFGTVAALALCVMALAADAWQRNLSSAMLLGLGALALGLALADPVAGLAATVAAGLPGVLVAITTPVDARGVRSAARELRAVAVTGAFALVAAALVSGPSGLVNLPTTVVGLAYLAMALAVAVRIGAIPFHTRVARVTGSAPTAALPLLLALAPAGFASAALVWIDGNIATTALPLDAERAVIIVVGLLCLLLGVLAATIQDDIEHVVGYSVIQDAGFVLLALAVFDSQVWEPARTWLLIYVVTKSAFAGWALAMRASFGTSRIGELSGWIRRAPLLAVTLGVIVAATVGIPSLLVFDVRSQIATLALGSPLALLAIVGGLASLLYYGRLARVGIGPVAPLVAAYPGVRPRGRGWAQAGASGRAGAAGDEGRAGAAPDVPGSTVAVAATAEARAAEGQGREAPLARERPVRRAGRGAEPLSLDLDGIAPAGDADEGSPAQGAAGPAVDAPPTSAAAFDAAERPVVEDDTPGPIGAADPTPAAGASPSAGVDAGPEDADGLVAATDARPGDADAGTDDVTPAFLLPPSGRGPTPGPRSGRAPRESLDAERPPSVRGPRIDQLRRDPKELTQAWAREALERAGLAPPSSGGTAADAAEAPIVEPVGTGAASARADAPRTEGTRADAPSPRAAGAGRLSGPTTGAPGEAAAAGGVAVGADDRPVSAAGGGASRTARSTPRSRRSPRAAGSDPDRSSAAAVLWEANRLLVLSVLALGLSLLGLAAAAGAFGVSEAARAQAPSPGGEIVLPGDLGGEPTGPDVTDPGAGSSPSDVASFPPEATPVP
ncbi:MAG: hypothetical protein MUE82_00655 [Chloroflexi bacterium]|nr:hypothetical protein [Chloroflexota bacterium]